MKTDFELKHFVPEVATRAEYEARSTYLNTIRKETYPDDPPISVEYAIKNALGWAELKNATISVWHLRQGDRVVAEFFSSIEHIDNPQIMYVELVVLPEYRRQGLATRLLRKVLELAEAQKCSSFLFPSFAKVPAGAALLEKIGAKRGLEGTVNQLDLKTLDRNLLKQWQANASKTAVDFELHFLEGPYPEKRISEFADLVSVMSTAPKDDLEMEDFTATPEKLREWEAYSAAQGITRWTYYAQHKASGELAGYTEMFDDPENPKLMRQDATGVLPKYRGHGLGKWLKAAMLEKVLAELPAVEFVRTGNANSNAPMLAINVALGFTPYMAMTEWQVETQKVKAYLEARAPM